MTRPGSVRRGGPAQADGVAHPVGERAQPADRAARDGAAESGQRRDLAGEFAHPGAEFVHAGRDGFGPVELAPGPVHGLLRSVHGQPAPG